ncbi:MAG: hypothetical protein AAGE94_22595, partial [Acidobacteriota bacterium]
HAVNHQPDQCVLYRLLRRVGYGVGWAFGLATLFIVWPGSVLYEHWLFYTWPVAGLLVVAAMALVRYEDTGSLRDAAVFLVALVAVCWIRSAFHLVYLMAAVTLLLIIPRSSSRRPILAMSAAAVALVALIFVKNLVLFGSFASSSWMGMSLWRIAGQGHPDVAALVADGTLPAIAAIDAFSPVGDYPERYREIPPRFADVEALTVEKKTVGRTVGRGFDNLNHVAYLDLSADYRQAASTMIRHDPVGFLGRVALAWGTYSKPSWEYDFVAHNRPALRGWIDAVTLASPRFAIERQVTGREPPFVFPLSSLLVIPAAFVVVMLAAIGRTRRVAAGTWRRGDAFLLFAATTIAYVGLVGNTFELGENHRFRVVTDPLLFVATLAVVRSWIVAYSTTRDQPDIERSSKLSEKTTEPP